MKKTQTDKRNESVKQTKGSEGGVERVREREGEKEEGEGERDKEVTRKRARDEFH